VETRHYIVIALLVFFVYTSYKNRRNSRAKAARLKSLESQPFHSREDDLELTSLHAVESLRESKKDAALVVLIACAIVFPIFILVMHLLSE
jgi:hypothetical protein